MNATHVPYPSSTATANGFLCFFFISITAGGTEGLGWGESFQATDVRTCLHLASDGNTVLTCFQQIVTLSNDHSDEY